MRDWNPEGYGRFGDLRLQPALDLLARVGALPQGDIVDLGCGTGVMGAAFRARFPDRWLMGLDASPAMLEKAEASDDYDLLVEEDIATWQPETPPALIYSNAALQWVGNHDELLPRLARMLAPGGVLAVQMPNQNAALSHAGWKRAFQDVTGEALVAEGPGILPLEAYFELLSPHGDLSLWQTDYVQHLPATKTGHPVRFFTETTFGRPWIAAANEADSTARLIEVYEKDMAKAYPSRGDGSVLFPFRRLFLTLRLR